MPGRLRCHIHKAYFGNVAWMLPKNSCGQCWKIHEEEINILLNRFGYKATLTITPIAAEDKATFSGPGAQAQGANMETEVTPDEMAEMADPLAGVPPITETETEGGGPAFVGGTKPMTVPEYKSPPGLEIPAGTPEEFVVSKGAELPLTPEPGAVIAVPERPAALPEIEVPAAPEPGEVVEVPTDPVPTPSSMNIPVPGVIGNADGTTPGQNKQETPGVQLDEAAESVINDLLRGK